MAEDAFEEWWKEYPRKVQKDAARKEFAAALKRGTTSAELLVALRRQRWPEDVRYIVYPARWLKRGSWQDDPGAAAPPAQAPAQPGKLDWMWREMMGDAPGPGQTPSVSFDFDGEAEEAR
ncbi:hypothetical protein WDZ92_51085 [Nostoc sp. NIES-2111]